MAGNSHSQVPSPKQRPALLKILLAAQERIKQRATEENIEEPPFLLQYAQAILFARTVSIIQGQNGSHKSRIVALMAAVILAGPDAVCETLGFTRAPGRYGIVYIDTERNLSSEYPAAIQRLKLWAGYRREQIPANLWHTSLIGITNRAERFEALTAYLEHVRTEAQGMHLVVIIDIITDCIEDFNDSRDSLQFVDMLNESINTYDVTFICVIHENPGTAKARGHLGTEIINKGGTALQIGYIKAAGNTATDVLELRYVKRRHGKPGLTFHARYDETTQQFTSATLAQVTEARAARQKVATPDQLPAALLVALAQPAPQQQVVAALCETLKAGERTIRGRLKATVGTTFPNREGQLVRLETAKLGTKTLYQLVPAG
ncbi:AAA family ATPase [Hymenobacter sp. BT188]|uniref:AAA family ATPase n=1 Tax=Hymenobacter sp. BT188 TaxID=2763504 RepID=UPI00165195D2|nr:AAA family ATPase [Hymenobacter sp. BT188]MBC6606263.1 AAA family ATPase [Hymenobacter sp. BT188]